MSTSSLALLLALAAGPAPDTVALFASDEPLAITLIGDLEAIRRDRAESPEDRPARLVLGAGDTLDVGLRPRGDARRDPATCSFPPLRLNLKKKQVEGTPFEGQDKLKMVVPCRPERDGWDQYVLKEYLIYKAYLLVSDEGFRVRLVNVRFIDTGGGRDPFTTLAFVLEDEDALAERMGGTVVDMPEGTGVRPETLNPRLATLVAVFQYLVGNTDWSDQALHNVKLIQGLGRLTPVPYDFDVSGIVNAPYAVPDPLLGLRDVRERLYRGWCFDEVDPEPLLRTFRDAQPAMEELFRSALLAEGTSKDAVAYLQGSYEDIATLDRAQRRLFRDCRPTR